MLHVLPAPIRGATHAEISEAAINVHHGYCVLRATLGSAALEGDHLDPALPQWQQTIVLQDERYQAFRSTTPITASLSLGDLVSYVDAEELWA